MPLTLVALLAIVPTIVVTRLFQVRVRDAERANRQAIGRLSAQLQEILSGVETIRAFDRAAVFTARFRMALVTVLAAYNRATIYSAGYTPLMALLAAGATALLLWSGAAGMLAGWGVSLGTLTAFVLLFGRFFDPISALGDDWQTVQSALSGIERITQVLAIPIDPRPAAPAVVSRAAGLTVQNLVFGYASEQPVVCDVTFAVRPGEQVALVGRTGAGKSSMIQLDCCVLDHEGVWSRCQERSLLGEKVGEDDVGRLSVAQPFVDVEQESLNERLRLLATCIPNGVDRGAPFGQ